MEYRRNQASRLLKLLGRKLKPMGAKTRTFCTGDAKKIRYPNFIAFVVPELSLVKDSNGKIIDVEISYPKDLVAQQTKWAGKK